MWGGYAYSVGLRTSHSLRKDGTKSEASAALASLPCFDIPTITVQENGTYGGLRQSRRFAPLADGFAVFARVQTEARFLGGRNEVDVVTRWPENGRNRNKERSWLRSWQRR